VAAAILRKTLHYLEGTQPEFDEPNPAAFVKGTRPAPSPHPGPGAVPASYRPEDDLSW